MPDGSRKEFRPTGFNDLYGDGFYAVMPSGYNTANCNGGATLYTTGGMTYYSTDGSYSKLVVDYAGNTGRGAGNPWTLYMADGSKIRKDNTGVRKFDRNGNSIQGLTDNFGRSISIQKNVSPNEDHISMTGVGGQQLTWVVTWKTITFAKQYTTTGAGGGIGRGGNSVQTLSMAFKVVDRITLPTQLGGLYYEFNYNTENSIGYGELSSVTLPSGAEAAYEYKFDTAFGSSTTTDFILQNSVSKKTLSYLEEYDGGSSPKSDVWLYNISKTQSTITSPDGTATTNYFSDTTNDNSLAGMVYKTSDNHGNISEKIWNHNGLPSGSGSSQVNTYVKTDFTTIPDANGNPSLTKIVDYTIDPNGNITETKEYDWVAYNTIPRDSLGKPNGIPGGAVLKRITSNLYYNSATTNTNNSYWLPSSPAKRDAVSSTTVKTSAGTPVAHSEFVYDNPATTGNVTQTKTWDSSKGGYSNPLSGGNSISSTVAYNGYGNPTLMTDAKGYQTKITYGAINGHADLYPTQTETAYGTTLEKTSTVSYDFYSGLVTSSTDADNNITSAIEYDDAGRPTKQIAADNTSKESWTQIEYDDVDRRVITRSDLFTLGDGKKVSITHYDQLGRIRLARTLEDSVTEDETEETHGIKVQTRYKYDNGANPASSNGEYTLTSNPYRAAYSYQAVNEATMGWEVEFEDKTGRLSTIETFSGAVLPAPWGSNANSTGKAIEQEDSNATTTTDEAGKKRRTIEDALGRLIRVDEPNDSNDLGSVNFPTQPTNYTYDTSGNLTQIIQGGQTRTFSYNSLARLLTANNPESGTFSYTYDANGNLLTKQDARGITTTYTYDALNRVTFRDYSNATPDLSYFYDEQSVPFSKGKLTRISSAASETKYTAFDEQERVVSTQQITDGQIYGFSYTYNLNDDLVTQTYPSGKVVKHEYDNGGDIKKVSKLNGQTESVYADSFGYSSHGKIEKVRFGNNRWEQTKFNSSLQITEVGLGNSAGGMELWKINYEYGELVGGAINAQKNNGNLARQTILVPTVGAAGGFTAVQDYTYDSLDRLRSATEIDGGVQRWKQAFLYDRFGNKNFDTPNTTTLGSCPSAVCNPAANQANNRLNGYSYDAAGNITTDGEGRTFTYDAENRQATAVGSGLSASYTYDGNDKRVKSYNALTNQTTIFVYDADGSLAAEYTINIPPPSNPTTSYLTEDALGSVRVVTDASGNVKARRDFLPFGDEIDAGIGNRTTSQKYSAQGDDTRKKFATYQRDLETGLDFAQSRYYSPTQGRFTSPDEFKGGPDELFDFEDDASNNPTFYADLTNPQSLNKYQYTYNNPYRYNDPNGHCPVCLKAWVIAEATLTAADVVATARTFRDPKASTKEKVVTVAGTVLGMALPGGGYGVAGKALVKASQGTKATKTVTKGSKKPVATGVTASGRKTDSKGRPIGPSGKLMQHNTKPSTRKRALDKVRNKKGASGVVIDRKNKFKGKRVKTHAHPVDKTGKRIEKDKEHVYLPKRNNPPGNRND